MALKKCEECGNEVSTKAKKCPNCGAKAPKRTSILTWSVLVIIIFVAYSSWQTKSNMLPKERKARKEMVAAKTTAKEQTEIKKEAAIRTQKNFEREIIYSAKKKVASSLKAPDSANFKDVFFNETNKGGAVACGQVNSKNSFGAYTGFQRFISNGKTVLLEEKIKNMGFTWAEVCLPDKE